MTTKTNTTTKATTKATARKSYVLAGKRQNQYAAKLAADETARKTNAGIMAVACINTMDDERSAKTAAKRALAVGTDAATDAAHAAMTLAGVFAYMTASANIWADSRKEVKSARFIRKNTAKTSSMQLVVETVENGTIYITANTTASIDWRKIDAKFATALAKRQAKKQQQVKKQGRK